MRGPSQIIAPAARDAYAERVFVRAGRIVSDSDVS